MEKKKRNPEKLNKGIWKEIKWNLGNNKKKDLGPIRVW